MKFVTRPLIFVINLGRRMEFNMYTEDAVVQGESMLKLMLPPMTQSSNCGQNCTVYSPINQ